MLLFVIETPKGTNCCEDTSFQLQRVKISS